ncbi:MAG: MMPL family transporter [Chloroflexota bacterium]
MFAALGRFDYRFRRWLPLVALALVIGLNIWVTFGGGKLIQGGWNVPGSEALRAEELLADRFGVQATAMIVVYRDPARDAGSAAFQKTVADSVSRVAHDPVVDGVLTYATTQDTKFLSRDRSATFALIRLNEQDEKAVDDAERLSGLVQPPPGVQTYVTGVPQLYHEFNDKIESDLVRAEMISLPIALIILLAVFGTLVGASLPMLMAALALPSAFAVIGLLASVTEMSIFVTNIASMIGLALAIDYSLFMVSRFREELRHHPVDVAVERMMATVGKAVAVSGIAVAIGLSALAVFESPALRSMGIAGVVTVVSTLVFALTVLPALLGMLGHRVNRLRVPLPRALRLVEDDTAAADRRQGHGVWAWVASRVMRRPLLIGLPVLGLLLVAGSPFLSLQLSTGGNLDDLPPSPARTGFEVLAAEFPGGDTDPIVAAVTYPTKVATDGLTADQLSGLRAYAERLRRFPGVKEVDSLLDPPKGMQAAAYDQLLQLPATQRPAQLQPWFAQWVAGDTLKVQVFSDRLPDSDAGRALVDEIRAAPPPPTSSVLTAGLSSRSRDFIGSFDRSVPFAVLIVVGVTALVLLLTFGSILLPIKAVLMSLLSVSASFGALVWIFQQGHLSGLLGFTPSGTLVASTPVIMFAILFGLSMDYEVLLLSRIRERYVATGNNTLAVAEGIGLTGGIITGAALVMVAVFGAFALSSVTFIKAIGLSQALAVLIDATVVRGILVPAFMRVMGRANWWAPGWLQRAIARVGLYEGQAPADLEHPATHEPEAAPAG